MAKSKRARSRFAPKPRSNPGTRKSAAPHYGVRARSRRGCCAGRMGPRSARGGSGRSSPGCDRAKGYLFGRALRPYFRISLCMVLNRTSVGE